jgi:agmatine deiminase
MITSPHQRGLRQPAEWHPHAAVWLAWPSHAELWRDDLAPARAAFAAMCRALSGGERLELCVLDAAGEAEARAALGDVVARYHHIRFGDIWLRDTGPIFVTGGGTVEAARFAWNGWGGKYLLTHDAELGDAIASAAGVATYRSDLVIEGGAIEVDGEGTCLTTRQCMLNPNRNPGVDEATIEATLRESLGIERCLWLDDGLANDHTDGHIDNLARFVGPGRVVCMEPRDADDPNRDVLRAIITRLAEFGLEVVCAPSPGRVLGGDGEVVPASYMNFYIGNRAVVVPVYGTRHDDEAVELVAGLFPGRRTVGIDARAVLSGGGAFHCISQQQPEPLP